MNDVQFKLDLSYDKEDLTNEKIEEASYAINEACAKLEELGFNVSYQTYVNGSKIIIKDP